MLLEHGAPIDVRDNDKKTPLDLAFQKGKGSTTRLLLNLILSRGQTFSQKRYSRSLTSSDVGGRIHSPQTVLARWADGTGCFGRQLRAGKWT